MHFLENKTVKTKMGENKFVLKEWLWQAWTDGFIGPKLPFHFKKVFVIAEEFVYLFDLFKEDSENVIIKWPSSLRRFGNFSECFSLRRMVQPFIVNNSLPFGRKPITETENRRDKGDVLKVANHQVQSMCETPHWHEVAVINPMISDDQPFQLGYHAVSHSSHIRSSIRCDTTQFVEWNVQSA